MMADDFDFDDLDFGSDDFGGDGDDGALKTDDFGFDSGGGDEADPFASVDFSSGTEESDNFGGGDAVTDDFSEDSSALPDMQFDINGDVDELAQEGGEIQTESVGDSSFEEPGLGNNDLESTEFDSSGDSLTEDASSSDVDAEIEMEPPVEETPLEPEPAPVVAETHEIDDIEIPEVAEPAFETDTHNVENVVMATESGTPVGSEMLLNVNHEAVIELGRTQLTGADISSITYGSIIELDKLTGEPVDVVLNGKVIAHGEVVLINNEKLGVRVIGIHQE